MKKNKSTLLPGTFKVSEKKVALLFLCWPLHRDIDHLCFWPVHEFDRNHLQGKSLSYMSFFRGHKILKEKLS